MSMIANTKDWFVNADGANDPDFIRAHEDLSPRGRFHAPISSADILTKFRDRARSFGLTLTKETCALKKDGTRYMYIANVENENRDDFTLQCGFRNSSDQSRAFNAMMGTSVFVCENGCCSSIVEPSKMRHTIGNARRFVIEEKVDAAFERFLADKDEIAHQIEVMKGTPLTDEILGHFVRKMNGEWCEKVTPEGQVVRYFRKNPYLGSANLLRVLEELDNPSLNSRDDSSCFRLLNAVSTVTTHKIKNPDQSAMASRQCNNLIMSIIYPGFKPLGDMVEVEAEVVEG